MVVQIRKIEYIYTKEPTSFDTEALFPLEGMEDTLNADQVQSSEEGSDTDGQHLFYINDLYKYIYYINVNDVNYIILRLRSR